MDLKKEIKLSDLFPGRKKKTAAAVEPKAEKPKKRSSVPMRMLDLR